MHSVFYAELGVLFFLVFLFTVIFCRVLIPVLHRLKAGQPILEIGPVWHLSKAGTPTMGGLAFVAAILAVLLLYSIYLLIFGRSGELAVPALILIYGMLCGSIGFFDDYRKLCRKQNQGLTAPQKYFLQLVASGIFLAAVRAFGGVDTTVHVPFSGVSFDLGFWYYPLALLFLTGVVNAFNLTDGLDGLLSSTVAVLAGFFLLFGISHAEGAAALIGVLLLGAALGFLVFNAHPAKVFMGDTGSLFFGGVAAALGIALSDPFTVLIAGGIYVFETLSVILQVLYFKLTHGKRLFLMAPFHHHLEKRGWSENRIVAVFSLATALFSALAFFGGRAT